MSTKSGAKSTKSKEILKAEEALRQAIERLDIACDKLDHVRGDRNNFAVSSQNFSEKS